VRDLIVLEFCHRKIDRQIFRVTFSVVRNAMDIHVVQIDRKAVG